VSIQPRWWTDCVGRAGPSAPQEAVTAAVAAVDCRAGADTRPASGFGVARPQLRSTGNFRPRGRSQIGHLLDETMARRFWRAREPIGDHIVFTSRRFEVVGIVADVHGGGARQDAAPAFYVPDAQGPAYSVTLVVRAARDTAGVEQAVADEIARMGGPPPSISFPLSSVTRSASRSQGALWA
jgi:hypothetical protein